jgi:phosphatidylinositol alpha-1,6-mannosyltransferase
VTVGKTLLVTNDFPPRQGGIQAFVHQLALRQDPGELIVFASSSPGAEQFDAEQPFPVVRYPGSMLLPTPGVARRVQHLVREYGCDRAWFGASAPLGLLAPALRRVGVERVVAQTHGHEVGWAALPVARTLLRRIAAGADVLTYLGDYTRRRIAAAVGDRTTFEWLPPGVDTAAYSPEVNGNPVRLRHGIDDRPVIVCVSRLVPRKGQDTLIWTLPAVRDRVPDATLLLVGKGPDEPRLRRLATDIGVSEHVVFTGGVPWEELPAHYAAGDVFAMPCRTRRAGMDVEGLGIVYLEASATGLPVIAGDSGGATDAVRDGETGFVVGGRNHVNLVERLVTLLTDPDLARKLGDAGRAWTLDQWQWARLAARMGELLRG